MDKILIIDDEPSIRAVLRLNLQSRGFEVAEAGDAASGLKKIESFRPDLVVLDLGLPDGNGLGVLRSIRRWSSVPVVVLTVSDAEVDKVELLESGADDYVTKPFGVSELLARIRVALRHRTGASSAETMFESDDLRVDLKDRKVWVLGRSVKVSATEFELLRTLILAGGQVVSQERLLTEIWGRAALGNQHYVRIYVGHLRKKIEQDPSRPKHIVTEPGVGYRIA